MEFISKFSFYFCFISKVKTKMETVSQFAGRYKTSSSVESIRVKNAHRRSLTRKESRYNQLRKSRKFGVSDFSPLKESCSTTGPENEVFLKELKPAENNLKLLPKARRELLQRYKDEKQLKKIQDEREKYRRGVFKVGVYKPEAPCFLPSEHTLMKTKLNQVEKVAPSQVGPLTRLTNKSLSEQPKNATTTRSQTTKIPCLSTFGPANRKGQKENTAPLKGRIEQPHSTRAVTAPKESKVSRGPVVVPPKVPVKITNPQVLHSRLTRSTASFAAKVQPKASVQVDVPHARPARPAAVSTTKMQNKAGTHIPVKKFAGVVQQKNENKSGNAAKGNLYDKVVELSTVAEVHSELSSVDLVVGANQNEYADAAEKTSYRHQDMSVKVELSQSSDAENSSETCLSKMMVETEEKCETAAGPSKVKGRISFAPQNFVFQPLDGLSAYRFNPMTPHSTEKFLSPCFTWSPLEIKRAGHLRPEDHIMSAEEPRTDATAALEQEMEEEVFQDVLEEMKEGPSSDALEEEMKQISPNALEEEMEVPQDTLVEEMKEVSTSLVEDVKEGEPLKEVMPSSSASPQEEAAGIAEKLDSIRTSDIVHDVPYFRNTIQSESDRLLSLAQCWEEKIKLNIPDEAKDLIRTTVGQTRLLIAERFKQFEGLVEDCEFKRGEKETTCTDLDGFWDMVSFQVEDVNKKYEKLVSLEASDWKPTLPQVLAKKLVKKKATVGVFSKPGLSDGGRAAAKSRLAAIKASMKTKLKQEETTEASSKRVRNADMVVFDAGFFRVESPAKLFNDSASKVHAIMSSGKCRSQTVAPGSISRTAKRSCIMSFASPINTPLQSTEISPTVTPIPFGNVEEQLERSVAEESEHENMMQSTQMNHESAVVKCLKSCLPSSLASVASAEIVCTNPVIAKVADTMVNSADPVSSDILMCSPEKEGMLEKNLEQSDVSCSLKKSNELQSLYSLGLNDTNTFPAASADGIHNSLENSGNSTPLEMAGLNCTTSPSTQNLAAAASTTISGDLIVFSPIGTPFHP